MVLLRRRTILSSLALPLLGGCAPLLPPVPEAVAPDAAALLREGAQAHGAPAFAGLHDVSVRYAGQWRGLVGSLQPALVDEGHRGTSEERLLLRDRLSAQSYIGPAGRKEVVRQMAAGGQGGVRVWFDGVEATDGERRAAAALVADGYALFLLGPLLLAGPWAADRALAMARAGSETVTVGGAPVPCDRLRLRVTPGLGLSPADELALWLGCHDRLLRRVRFTLNGLASTQGAVAEVDMWGHVPLDGISWPTRFHERLLRPVPLPVHDWRLEGLDLDRGMQPAEVAGPALLRRAAAPASPLGTGGPPPSG